jgi:hypothetical protein
MAGYMSVRDVCVMGLGVEKACEVTVPLVLQLPGHTSSRRSVVAVWSRQGTAQCPSMARQSSCEALGTLVTSRWTVHDTLHALW